MLRPGALLLPLGAMYGQDLPASATLWWTIRDAVTGQPVAAKMRIEHYRSGQTYLPAHAIKTMPQRSALGVRHYFYARGSYEVALPRVASQAKTHAGYTVFAHTSTAYFRLEDAPFRRAEPAGALVDHIQESMRFIRKKYRFASDSDRALVVGRFETGRKFFARLVAEGQA